MNRTLLCIAIVMASAWNAGCVHKPTLWPGGSHQVHVLEKGKLKTFYIMPVGYGRLYYEVNTFLVTEKPKQDEWWLTGVINFSPEWRNLVLLGPMVGWLTMDQPQENRVCWVVGNNPPIIAIGDVPASAEKGDVLNKRGDWDFITDQDWDVQVDTVIARKFWRSPVPGQSFDPDLEPPEDRFVHKLDPPMTLREACDNYRRWLRPSK